MMGKLALLKARKAETLFDEIVHLKLPAPIDPEAVTAEFRDGLLRVTAAIAEQHAKKTDVHAA